tara:strand:+ start:436 stop:1422 length:987 start_codon:yes stop_codon:yes gene_type:complete
MSTRKKRSLSNLKVTKEFEEPSKGQEKKIVPAVSNFLSNDNTGSGKAIRGMEFLAEPDKCRPWKYHNRNEAWLNPERCADLISSISKNGQQFPIIARRLENDADGKSWEIIAGRRRWYACSYLGKKVRIKAFSGNDRECAIIMHLENKDRDDVSEFENAISYKYQLDSGLFTSQEEMTVALALKKSKLSKMLIAAKIINYKDIIKLFPDLTQLKVNPVYSLVSLIEKNDKNKEVLFKKAENLYYSYIKKGKILKSSVLIQKLIESLSESHRTSVKKNKFYLHDKEKILKIGYESNGNLFISLVKDVMEDNEKDFIKNFIVSSLDDYLT